MSDFFVSKVLVRSLCALLVYSVPLPGPDAQHSDSNVEQIWRGWKRVWICWRLNPLIYVTRLLKDVKRSHVVAKCWWRLVAGRAWSKSFAPDNSLIIIYFELVWSLKCLIHALFYNLQTIQGQIVDSGYSQTISSCSTCELFGETYHFRIAQFHLAFDVYCWFIACYPIVLF